MLSRVLRMQSPQQNALPNGRHGRVHPPPPAHPVLASRRRHPPDRPVQDRASSTAWTRSRSPTTATCTAWSTSTRRPRTRASSPSSAARPTSRRRRWQRQDRAQELPPHPARQEQRGLQEPPVPQLRWGSSRASTTTRASTRSCSRSTRRGSSASPRASAARSRRRSCSEGYEKAKEAALEYKSLFEAGLVLPRGAAQRPRRAGAGERLLEEDGASETGIGLVATGDCHYVQARATGRRTTSSCASSRARRSNDPGRLEHRTPTLLHQAARGVQHEVRRHSRGAREHGAHRQALQRRARARQDLPAEVQGPRGLRHRQLLAQGGDGRARAALRREARRAARRSIASSTAQRLEIELDVIMQDGSSPATSSSSGTSSATPRSRASPSGRAAARAPARSSRTRCASPTSIRSRTTCCSSASSIPSASGCPTSTSTSAWTGAARSSSTSPSKYGKNNVGQIVTLHQLKSRGVIRDVARVMAIPYAEADKVAKLVPSRCRARRRPSTRRSRSSPSCASSTTRTSPCTSELIDTAQRARGAQPPRRHARRRRRHRREAALGVRARARAAPRAKSSRSSPRTRSSRPAW